MEPPWAGEPSKICPRTAEFSPRPPKSDRLLGGKIQTVWSDDQRFVDTYYRRSCRPGFSGIPVENGPLAQPDVRTVARTWFYRASHYVYSERYKRRTDPACRPWDIMNATVSTPTVTDILLRVDHDGVATLTLNLPKQYNVLSRAMLARLQEELDSIAGDRSVRVVVIAANGKAFCAGHNLKEMRAHPDKAFQKGLFDQCSTMMMSLVRLPQPVIARVQGIATAAGCQLVATCDLAVASSEARFAVSGTTVGLFCGTPSVALSRNIPRKQAMEMLITGEFINAQTALARGLVNRVAPPDQLDAVLQQLIDNIVNKSMAVLGAGKQLFYRQLEAGLSGAYEQASEFMACSMLTHDAGEGIDAFIAKRKPHWDDR